MQTTATDAGRADRKPPTSDAVCQELSRAIHEHRLAPGTKLGEDELAEIFGVSRTIIRTALQSLAHGKLVEIHRNRGAFVAKPTPEEAREIFEARELLEPRTARSAAIKATPEDVAVLRAHIAKEHAALKADDRGLALYLSGQLHVHIARIAAQATIAAFIETLVARSSLIVALYWKRQRALCESHAHNALVTAIASNDGQAAEELMHSHLVDLHSALDLKKVPVQGTSLKEILG
ncbi:GntR family transcriptional regulator [Marimonas sp. MJW-29]|uniref:GntR family transcriptional regulator n=1 Tax=Sulfitobacter sediminis TaxID=3234186 RepID=A0ABV3RVK6_9RHOB